MLPVSRLIRSVSVVALTASALLSVSLVHADVERTLSTKFGDVTLSGDPQRVVVLEDEALDTALALGLKPVATLATRGGSGVPAYLQERVGDIKIVGSIREPNLEAVFAVKPDLIIASSNLDKSLYEKLSIWRRPLSQRLLLALRGRNLSRFLVKRLTVKSKPSNG